MKLLVNYIKLIINKDNPDDLIKKIKSCGMKASISVKPKTQVESIYHLVEKLDMILIMTVEPGFGGQKLIPECLDKVKKLRDKFGSDLDIQVDGGVVPETAKLCKEAGANVFVAGSYIYGSDDPAKAMALLKEALNG